MKRRLQSPHEFNLKYNRFGIGELPCLRVEGEADGVDRQALRAVGRVVVLRLHLLERGGRAFVDLQLEDVAAAGMLGDDVRAQKK